LLCCIHRSRNLHVKKTLLILAVVMMVPVLVATLVIASGDWRPIGQTAAGDTVSVSSVHSLRGGQRTALVRVQYKEPAELLQGGSSLGGPFVEMRALVRFRCADRTALPATEWFYSRDRNGRIVVTRKITHDDQFGQSSEGGLAQLVSDSVCRPGK
jgi:hypothetical protein